MNPATGLGIADIPDMGTSQTMEAIAAATKAQDKWGGEPAAVRSALLMKLHALVLKNADALATLVTLECGKPWEVGMV